MPTIGVDISAKVMDEFRAKCSKNNMLPSRVLAALMHDITASHKSGGPEDQQRAAEWMERKSPKIVGKS